MTIEEVIESYKQTVEEERTKLGTLKKQIFRVGSIRIAVFLLCIAVCYLLWGNTLAVFVTIMISTVLFLGLLKFHNKLFIKKTYCEIKIKNAEDELKGINYDFSAFDGASELNDGEHSFSMDLDIFGNRSFFQSINRTVTMQGKDSLAQTVIRPCEVKKTIEDRQRAVQELSKNSKLLTHFRVIGSINKAEKIDVSDFSKQFLEGKLYSKTFWRFMPYIFFAIATSAILLYSLNLIHISILTAVWTLLLCVSTAMTKVSMKKMQLLDKKLEGLQTYANLFKIIENEKFECDYLIDIQQKLKGDITASASIDKLAKLSSNFFQSTTIAGIMILNPLLMWNMLYNTKIERWAVENFSRLDNWFISMAIFDSLTSLAIYAYNHPEYIYPKVSTTPIMAGQSMGHPIIKREVCVKNDIDIEKQPFFMVVTGANMAGKSTYLRTIGLNLVIAATGAPVCASSFKFFPYRLVTNLRTSDSLIENESYFFAELKRLKMIIDRLQAGEPLFIILDEILKGTNSLDKQKGSIALMKQLVSLNGNGIIATHDLILGKLEDEYPNSVKNYRFEAEIKDEQLSFTYKMREGIAENMNACFLMKKMGIVGI